MDPISFEVSDTIASEVDAQLECGLVASAIAKNAPPYQKTDLSIVLRGDDGKVVAGLTGKTFWDWLYVDSLWVEDKLRGQGIGASLMQQAEEEALRRGCHSCYLWTESFEAPQFYVRQGYKEFVVMDDFPVGGHQHIGFMKRLVS